MAHRKLFSSSPEGSIDCTIYFCDWSCPNYPCVLFPPINYSAFISPPTPPQPSRHQSVSPFIIALISILSIVFVMAFCCALFRNDPNSNNLSNETDNHNPRLHRQLGEERLNQNLSPRGMEPVLIKSIKAYKYKKSDGSINGTDCSVCLCEFEEDETLRRLPKCSHYFHTNCIDTWLSSHANCPLCRASILSISSPSTDSVDQNVGNLSGNEEIQIRIGEVSNDEWRENRGET